MPPSVTLVEPAHLHVPDYRWTLGPEVGDLCAEAGFPPDPEQQLVLDGIFGYVDRDRVAAKQAGLVAGRQNIKTGTFKQTVLGWGWLEAQPLIRWSAHEFDTAQASFRDLDTLIEGSEMLSRRVRKISRGHGDESIQLFNGCRIDFKARTKTGGRGIAGPKTILDEGFALRHAHMGALLPIMSTFGPSAQVLIGSSAALADSEVLHDLVERGRAGDDPALLYAEWCDDLGGSCEDPRCTHRYGQVQGCRYDDEARWARANSQLGRRIEVEHIRFERRSLSAEEFGRERMGYHDKPAKRPPAISADQWDLCRNDLAKTDAPRLAFDISPALSHASVSLAGPCAEHLYLEVCVTGMGFDWLAGEVARLHTELDCGPVGYLKGSASEAVLTQLESLGVPTEAVAVADYAATCGEIVGRASSSERSLRHTDQAELNLAVGNAALQVGVARAIWDRRVSDVDITPLCAATVAAHLAQQPDDTSVYEERGALVL